MDDRLLHERIAQLEFQNDQLLAELEDMDSLLRTVGFQEGASSVKRAARELIDYEQLQQRRFEDGLPEEPPGLD